MQKLVDGVHQFQTKVFRQQQWLFEQLKEGQKPQALFITCSDSRINPNLITQTEPGELFIVRNVGNIIPPHGTTNNAEAAAVEYSVEALGITDIVVCGHTHCGAMKGLLQPELLNKLPNVKSWLQHADATASIIRENYEHLSGEALVTAAAEENVLVQVEHLHTLPTIAAKLSRGKVTIHAWMYKFETGELFSFDVESRQFLPIVRKPRGQKKSVAAAASA